MKRLALLLLVVALSGGASWAQETAPGGVTDRGSLFKIGRDVVLAVDERAENIIVIGGRVTIEGEVLESVLVFGGSASVSGHIGEDLLVMGGDVTLEDGAFIGRNLTTSGVLRRSPTAEVRGEARDREVWTPLWHELDKSARFVGEPTAAGFFFGLIVMLLFAWLVAYLFPKGVHVEAEALERAPWRVLAFGFLSLLLFALLIVFLIVTILGIAAIPLVAVAYAAAGFIGVVGCSLLVGSHITRRFQTEPMGTFVMISIGVAILAVLRLIPVIGELLTLALWLMGFGVVLLTRFGTLPVAPRAG